MTLFSLMSHQSLDDELILHARQLSNFWARNTSLILQTMFDNSSTIHHHMHGSANRIANIHSMWFWRVFSEGGTTHTVRLTDYRTANWHVCSSDLNVECWSWNVAKVSGNKTYQFVEIAYLLRANVFHMFAYQQDIRQGRINN